MQLEVVKLKILKLDLVKKSPTRKFFFICLSFRLEKMVARKSFAYTPDVI
jgi:hypothetical protein